MPFLTERASQALIIRISSSPFVIGRAVTCDFILPRPTISREHAVFRSTASGWAVQNRSRTNPVIINQQMVVTERQVVDGDRVTIGDGQFQFHSAQVEATEASRSPTLPCIARPSDQDDDAATILSGVVHPNSGAAGILALVNSAGISGKMTFFGKDRAVVWLDRGQIIQIQAGSSRDADAVTLLGRWTFESFSVANVKPCARTLPTQWSFNRIVLEVGRLHDSIRRDRPHQP